MISKYIEMPLGSVIVIIVIIIIIIHRHVGGTLSGFWKLSQQKTFNGQN
jgi:hypothetical protein